jgi:hypothetical protein
MAALRLTVPAQSTTSGPSPLARPAKLREWLGALPYGDMDAASREIHRALYTLNRQPMGPEARLGLTELFRHPYRLISDYYQILYTLQEATRHQSKRDSLERLRLLTLELSFAYKAVVNEYLQRAAPKAPEPTLIKAAERALHHSALVLIDAYASYRTVPIKTWREVHLLYAFAERYGFSDTPVEEAGNGREAKTTVACAYKSIVLTALTDPYHLARGDIQALVPYLHKWADNCAVTPWSEVATPNGLYVIDLAADTAPIPATVAHKISNPERFRVLDCRGFATQVEKDIGILRGGHLPKELGLETKLGAPQAVEILERATGAWRARPRRQFPRQTAEMPALVTVGLSGVHCVLSNLMTAAPQQCQVTEWYQLNESLGGMTIRCQGYPAAPLTVGHILGVQMPDAESASQPPPWMVAVVRWMRDAGEGSMSVGIQVLARDARPVGLRALIGEPMETKTRPALLIPNVEPGNRASTLLAPKGLYQAGRSLVMQVDERELRLAASQLVDASPGHDRFHYRLT